MDRVHVVTEAQKRNQYVRIVSTVTKATQGQKKREPQKRVRGIKQDNIDVIKSIVQRDPWKSTTYGNVEWARVECGCVKDEISLFLL